MKFFKYTLVAAVSAMALGFTACSDDDNNYQPGQPSAGLYFPEAEASVTLETASTEFTVAIKRAGISEAGTYALVSEVSVENVKLTAEENPFNVPASVSFGEGTTDGNIVVTVDASTLEVDMPYTINFTLGADVPGFNYGTNACSVTVTRAAAWTEWRPYGDGLATWNYAQGFFSSELVGDDPDLPLSIRDNAENPNQHQFLLEHWAFNTNLIIDWDSSTNYAQIQPQPVGTNINVTNVGSLPAYIATIGALNPVEANLAASTFDPETGEFDLYVYYIVPYNGSWGTFDQGGYEYLTCGEYADYSLEIVYNGYMTSVDETLSANITVSVGAQASKALFAASNEVGAQALLGKILDGTANTVEVAAGENQIVDVPLKGAGDYVLVGVTYKGDEHMEAAYVQFSISAGGAGSSSWSNVATVDFVDGWCTPFWQFSNKETGEVVPYTQLGWQVQGQQNNENPNLYRMKSPWTNEDCILQYLKINTNTVATDLLIDVTNPNCVKIGPQYSGMTAVDEEGELSFYIANPGGYFSAMGVEDAAIIAEGFNDVWDEGYLEINLCLIGWSIDEVSLNHPDQPYAIIYFDLPQSSKAHKVGGMRKHTGLNASRVNAAVRSNFRIPATKTRNLRPAAELVVSKDAFHLVK